MISVDVIMFEMYFKDFLLLHKYANARARYVPIAFQAASHCRRYHQDMNGALKFE